LSAAGTTCVAIADRPAGSSVSVEIPVDGHGDRPGNRRGRHDQHVRPVVGRLGPQRVALLHAEPVLLVDDHQAEVGELDLLLQQGMRADHDPGVAGKGVRQRRTPGRRADRPGEQRHAGGVVRGAQLPAPGQRAEHVGDRAVVLLGQDFGRGQQRGLATRVDHLEHGPDRDHCLARADLALQQPVHRVGAGQVVGDGLAHRHLARGEGERQSGVELVGDAVVHVRPGHGRQGGGGHPPLGQRGLQHERLVPLQPQHGPLLVRPVQRAVDGPDGFGPAVQPVPFPQFGGQRIGPGVQGLQDGLDRPADGPRADLGGGRVDRDQLGGELGGQLGGQVGVGRRAGQHLVLRVDQLEPAAEAGHGAREHAHHAGHELSPEALLGSRGPEEEGQHQLGAVVGDDHLAPRAEVAVGHRAHADVINAGQHGHVVALTQRGQVGQLAAGVVAPRIVPQQVADRGRAEGGLERLAGLGAQRPGQRFAERGHTWQHRRAARQLLATGGRPPWHPPHCVGHGGTTPLAPPHSLRSDCCAWFALGAGFG
jgi:hypothetical protein